MSPAEVLRLQAKAALRQSVRLQAAELDAEQTDLRLRAQNAEQAKPFPLPAVMAATPRPESSHA